ncbi:hypothetical protein [Archangium minus]
MRFPRRELTVLAVSEQGEPALAPEVPVAVEPTRQVIEAPLGKHLP